MAMTGQHTLAMIAEAVGRARSCIQTWLHAFETGGVDALLQRTPPPGRPLRSARKSKRSCTDTSAPALGAPPAKCAAGSRTPTKLRSPSKDVITGWESHGAFSRRPAPATINRPPEPCLILKWSAGRSGSPPYPSPMANPSASGSWTKAALACTPWSGIVGGCGANAW